MSEHSNDLALYYFHQGTNFGTGDYLGCHLECDDGEDVAVFRVWAPNAAAVSVIGDFNGWDAAAGEMQRLSDGGIYECRQRGAKQFDCYKYQITSADGRVLTKSDPYGFHFETRPSNASKVYSLGAYKWSDGKYLAARRDMYEQPMNIYEVHLGSWRLHEDGNPLTYRELAQQLPAYAADMGYTHVELLPVSEFPFDGSWGYQVTGYYAPTSRFGTPEDFMYFVDCCHRHGIGVILDWVPAHFPKDEFGLCEFDGGYCYEPADPLQMEHREWGTRTFDYARNEVQSFLISNALFWLRTYHADGLRVDAVASMLYLDYGRKSGEWRPNSRGGRENLAAVAFLQKLNSAVFARFPHALMIAEESTAWPLVTGPVDEGGLGFNFKWNMGWMNDLLEYMSLDPLFRSGAHEKLTFSMYYAFSENYVLPLSHDEVVHGKCSLINKLPGSYDEKFDSLRAFFAYMTAHPGKKLSFMGNEFAQFIEWDYQKQLDWLLLGYEKHARFQRYMRELNKLYKNTPALWQIERSWQGFRWINAGDRDRSVLSFLRFDSSGEPLAVICNFSPVDRDDYLIGLPSAGKWQVLLDSSAAKYGGSGGRRPAHYTAADKPFLELPCSLSISLRGNSAVFLRRANDDKDKRR